MWRSDASRTSRKKSDKSGNERNRRGNNRKKSEKPAKSGNERNRKGNNFVTAGPIWIRSEKSGNDTKVKRNNCETSVRKKDTKGIYYL